MVATSESGTTVSVAPSKTASSAAALARTITTVASAFESHSRGHVLRHRAGSESRIGSVAMARSAERRDRRLANIEQPGRVAALDRNAHR